MVRRISIGCSGFDQWMVVHQRRLVRARHALRVPRRAVPRARHDALVARDLLVLDLHPVPERAARRVEIAVALRLGRPFRRIPLVVVERLGVAALDASHQRVVPVLTAAGDSSTVSMPRAAVRPSVEKRAAGPTSSRSIISLIMSPHVFVPRGDTPRACARAAPPPWRGPRSAATSSTSTSSRPADRSTASWDPCTWPSFRPRTDAGRPHRPLEYSYHELLMYSCTFLWSYGQTLVRSLFRMMPRGK